MFFSEEKRKCDEMWEDGMKFGPLKYVTLK
jgi:hypothetical protein